MTFAQLHLHPTLIKTLTRLGYDTPTPIQHQAIPALRAGRDVLGSAQTGTGKTAAFALPIIEQLTKTTTKKHTRRQARALVLAPTRELALQIRDSFRTYATGSPIKVTALFGGAPKRNQIQTLKRGVDIIVATPGRLIDLLEMKVLRLDQIEHYVLDEADRMLDMGFIPDVRNISARLPKARQTMLFSATLPESILALVKDLLRDPVRIKVDADNTPLDTINQSVSFSHKSDKPAFLQSMLSRQDVTSAIVFVRTKHGANRLSKTLNAAGLNTDAIHGNKTQSQRQETLKAFKVGKTKILIATDVASRGLDIDGVSHVYNFDMPETPETYVHRIGRTARAGRSGHSVSLCSPEESHLLKAIQQHIAMRVPVVSDARFSIKETVEKPANKKPKKHTQSRRTKSHNKAPFYTTYQKKKPSKRHAHTQHKAQLTVS